MTSSAMSGRSVSLVADVGSLSLLSSLFLLFALSVSAASPPPVDVPYISADRVIAGWVPQSVSAFHGGAGNVWTQDGFYGIRAISLDGSTAPSYLFTGSAGTWGTTLDCVVPDRSNPSQAWMTLRRGMSPDPTQNHASLVLVNVVSQEVVAEFSVDWSQYVFPIGSDQEGNVVVRKGGDSGLEIAVISPAGVRLSNFTLTKVDSVSHSDMDANGNVWVVQAPNGFNRNLVLSGYSIDGSLISLTYPNFDDFPILSINGMAVDSTGIAYFTFIKSSSMPSWVTSTSTRGQTFSIALVSNLLGSLLTLYSDSLALIASPGMGAIEQIDLTEPTPQSSHPIVQSSQANVYGAAKMVMYNGANPSSSVLFITSQGQGSADIVGVNPVTGAPVTRCPFPTTNILNSNLAVGSMGTLYAITSFPSGLQVIDPTVGGTDTLGLLAQKNFDPGYVAYDLANDRLYISGRRGDQVTIYHVNGTAVGGLTLKESFPAITDVHFVSLPSGESFFLVLNVYSTFGVTAFDLQGNVAGTLSIAPYAPIAFDVQQSTGFTYILGKDTSLGSTYQFNYIGVFDDSGVLTQWLAPPSTWTWSQDMRGVAVDTESNVYATTFTYNAVAVWSASSYAPRQITASLRASSVLGLLAGSGKAVAAFSWIHHAASAPRNPVSTSLTSSSVRTTQSVLSWVSLSAVLLMLAAVALLE